MNDELMERLAKKRGSSHRTHPRAADTAPLNYQSPPKEVQAWLMAKGFSQQLSTRHQQKMLTRKTCPFTVTPTFIARGCLLRPISMES